MKMPLFLALMLFLSAPSYQAFAMGKAPLKRGETQELPYQALRVVTGSATKLEFSKNHEYLLFLDEQKILRSYHLASGKMTSLDTLSVADASGKLADYSQSPKGNYVIVSTGSQIKDDSSLWLTKIDGSEKFLLSEHLKNLRLEPRKLFSGNKILFLERNEDGTKRLLAFDSNSKKIEILKPEDKASWDIIYYNVSPSGNRLAYIARNGATTSQRLFIHDFSIGHSWELPLNNIVADTNGRELAYESDQGESLRFSSDENTLFFLGSTPLDEGKKSFKLFSYNIAESTYLLLSPKISGPGIHEFWLCESAGRIIFVAIDQNNKNTITSINWEGNQVSHFNSKLRDDNGGVQDGTLALDRASGRMYFQAKVGAGDRNLRSFLAKVDGQVNDYATNKLVASNFLGAPLLSTHRDFVFHSSMPDDSSHSDLFAINLFDGSEIQISAALPTAHLGVYAPTSRNHVIYNATELREKMDLYLGNFENNKRIKLNHTLLWDEEISTFAISEDESWVSYVSRKGLAATLWVRPLQAKPVALPFR